MTVERQQYSAEFKRDAVRMVTESGQSASQLARTLGIHSNVLRKWKRQLTLAEETQAAGRRGRSGAGQSGHESSSRYEMIQRLHARSREPGQEAVSVKQLYQILGVSLSGYYDHLRKNE